ncbi:MAG TPA: DUF4325 domain-containing protein [Gallionella sp.]|nr:DUF4325 domain-containing protein [Gallionella sp.]
MRQTSKVSLSVPTEFTFNRGGSKYFDTVLSFLDWNLQDIPVEIDFSNCQSANYQAAALLIPYCWKLKNQGCTVSFKHNEEGDQNGSRVWKMMGGPGLFAVTTDPKQNFRFNEHKPLFAIRNSDDFKEALASADSFTSGFGVEYQKTLRYVISELLYNTIEHGKSDFFWQGHRYPTPSILQFTWYEKINELHFIVADAGIGIKQHLSQVHPALGSDEEALRLAIQPEISGTFGLQDPYTNRNNAGMGLYLSSSIVRRLRADMHIFSGDGMLHVSPTDITSKQYNFRWPGTFVLITVRLDRGTEFALDALMSEFRGQARREVDERNTVSTQNQFYLHIYNYFGRYADDKQAAIDYRGRHLLPAVEEGKSFVVDFQGVESSTHSFLNALFASPIKRMGLLSFKRIRIVNATSDIRETVDYILNDNTNEDADPNKSDH